MLLTEITNIKDRLKELLKSELPGEKSHRLLLPPGRELQSPKENNSTLQSSVLMLLFPDNGKLNTCLIRRTSAMRHHGGQIAFPGGRHETWDKDLIDTALRESNEEIGTDRNQIEILGGLTPLYVQVSNFTINPFVGWIDAKPNLIIDNQEVEATFIVPVEMFSHRATAQIQTVTTLHGTFEVPGFYIDQLFIWGATAMVISEFNEIYKTLTINQ